MPSILSVQAAAAHSCSAGAGGGHQDHCRVHCRCARDGHGRLGQHLVEEGVVAASRGRGTKVRWWFSSSMLAIMAQELTLYSRRVGQVMPLVGLAGTSHLQRSRQGGVHSDIARVRVSPASPLQIVEQLI